MKPPYRVWIVEDYKDGSLIGIYTSYDVAQRVAEENIERSTVTREVEIAEDGYCISTKAMRKDPEKAEISVDPSYEELRKAERASVEALLDRRGGKWWQFWKGWR